MYLAGVINELDVAWANRLSPENILPHGFDAHVTGSVDSFPIEICRPADGVKQSLFYSGKYAKHVVKVSTHNNIG